MGWLRVAKNIDDRQVIRECSFLKSALHHGRKRLVNLHARIEHGEAYDLYQLYSEMRKQMD